MLEFFTQLSTQQEDATAEKLGPDQLQDELKRFSVGSVAGGATANGDADMQSAVDGKSPLAKGKHYQARREDIISQIADHILRERQQRDKSPQG